MVRARATLSVSLQQAQAAEQFRFACRSSAPSLRANGSLMRADVDSATIHLTAWSHGCFVADAPRNDGERTYAVATAPSPAGRKFAISRDRARPSNAGIGLLRIGQHLGSGALFQLPCCIARLRRRFARDAPSWVMNNAIPSHGFRRADRHQACTERQCGNRFVRYQDLRIGASARATMRWRNRRTDAGIATPRLMAGRPVRQFARLCQPPRAACRN